MTAPVRTEVAVAAPVRICDVGGWTDTWFGAPGQVCSLAVGPAVTVTATAGPVSSSHQPDRRPVRLRAPDVRIDHRFGPHPDHGWAVPTPSAEPLLEHAVAEVLADLDPTGSQALTVDVRSAVPPGASLGTSAAVIVATIAAVRGLWADADHHVDPAELATAAHRVETRRAGREAGIQDHWAAALGGAVHIAIDTYPHVRELPLELPEGLLQEVGDRVVTVALGSHDSSEVHGEVARAFLTCDGVEHDRVRRAGRDLAALAGQAAARLADGDVDGWAEVLARSTEAQRHMHPGLIGPAHERAIEVARSAGAIGWKVNGAGGRGGSLSVVAPPGRAAALREALGTAEPTWTVLDLEPQATGVTVTRSS